MATPGPTYDDLKRALSKKQISPVYLFFGEEEFLVTEATQSLIEAALTPDERSFNLDVVYGSEADAREIVNHAMSFPMMAERRVVVVRDLDKLVNRELLSAYIESPSPTTVLILISVKPDFRKKPYATAKRGGSVFEFKPLYENEVPSWIVRRVKEQGKTIETDASKILTAFIGNSLRDIQNELEKLYIFVGDRNIITEADVRAVVGISKEFNIFELQKALGMKNLKRSVEILDRMIDSGEKGTTIIFMLTRYFLTLWRLPELQRKGTPSGALASAVGVNPYYLKEYQEAAQRYSGADIERAFDMLAEADEQLKSTSFDPKMVLQGFLVRIIENPRLTAA